MEYVVTTNRSFQAVEAQAIGALERHGFLVQRTFSLHSAARPEREGMGGNPGYSVLMLYGTGEQYQPLALVTLYEWQGQTVIESLSTSLMDRQQLPLDPMDVEAELAAALSLGGLDFCVKAAGGTDCVGLVLAEDGETTSL